MLFAWIYIAFVINYLCLIAEMAKVSQNLFKAWTVATQLWQERHR